MSTQYASAPTLLKESKQDNLLIDHKPDFKPIDLSKTKTEFDFQEELNKAAAGAKNNTLRIDEILPEKNLITTGLIDEDILLLQEARGLIGESKYAEALKKLDIFLSNHPNHPEALYLKALCLNNLDESMDSLVPQINALSTLALIKETTIDKSLSGLINILKKRITGQVYIKFVLLLILNPQNALESITSLIKYDPFCPDYYALKAILLNSRQKYFDAFSCINEGIRISGNYVSPMLTGLKKNTEAQILYVSLLPSIRLFKTEKYSEARKVLLGASDFIKGMEEYQLFERYLKKLSGGGIFIMFSGKKTVYDVKIESTPEQRQKLQMIIAREELDRSQAAIARNDIAGAEKILKTAVEFVPGLPLVCFLLAGCKFRLFNDRFFGGIFGSMDSEISELTEARLCALLSADDRQIPEAKLLLQQIDQAISFMELVKVQVEGRQKEVAKVNELIKEFTDIMSQAQKGIDSLKTFETLFSRMQQLKKSAINSKSLIFSADSQNTLNDLFKAIDINLKEMETVSKAIDDQKIEMKPVNKIGDRFTKVMNSIKGGINSEKQLNKTESDLESLKRDVNSCKSRLHSEAAKNNLKQLEEVINTSLGQLDRIKNNTILSISEKKDVEKHNSSFKFIVDFLNSGQKFETRAQLRNFRDLISKNRTNAINAKKRVKSKVGEETLTQIISQYDSILSQLNRIL